MFNSVLPLIRDALSLTDKSVSLIAVFFNLFYAAMVPIGGWVGDRFSRKWVTTLSILFWSVATMFTGLANGVFLLILTRSIATGGGEAFFGPFIQLFGKGLLPWLPWEQGWAFPTPWTER